MRWLLEVDTHGRITLPTEVLKMLPGGDALEATIEAGAVVLRPVRVAHAGEARAPRRDDRVAEGRVHQAPRADAGRGHPSAFAGGDDGDMGGMGGEMGGEAGSGYFDHVKCPSCKAQIDPERLEVSQGRAACPRCGAAISLKNLFGLKDSFSEEDAEDLSLDDLMPGRAKAAGPKRSADPGLEGLVPWKKK